VGTGSVRLISLGVPACLTAREGDVGSEIEFESEQGFRRFPKFELGTRRVPISLARPSSSRRLTVRAERSEHPFASPSILSVVERDPGILVEAGFAFAPEYPDHDADERDDEDQVIDVQVHSDLDFVTEAL
jgi:hypothetical protein